MHPFTDTWVILITCFLPDPCYCKEGGVPGGVLDGDGDLSELLCGDLLCNGGIQTIHTLLGLGPKFIPPQLLQGGVGGGVHEDDRPLLDWGRSGDVKVREGVVTGGGGG